MKNSLVEIGIGVVEGVASGMGAPLPEACLESNLKRRYRNFISTTD